MNRPALEAARDAVDAALSLALDRIAERRSADGKRSAHQVPARLLDAMRYSLLSPGKRLRPALVIGGAEAVESPPVDVLFGACAIEMIHAYSLIHDDLPIMDDDDLRRGRPTCHRAFDPATALLAGDALLTEAAALLADGRPLGRGRRVGARSRIRAIRELYRAAGAGGMVGGQYDDVALGVLPKEDRRASLLISIHKRKTGRLIQAAPAIGAILGGGTKGEVRALRKFGADIGLAFQLVDDALDGDGVARLEGPTEARRAAAKLTRRALHHLLGFGAKAATLRALAEAMVSRDQ